MRSVFGTLVTFSALCIALNKNVATMHETTNLVKANSTSAFVFFDLHHQRTVPMMWPSMASMPSFFTSFVLSKDSTHDVTLHGIKTLILCFLWSRCFKQRDILFLLIPPPPKGNATFWPIKGSSALLYFVFCATHTNLSSIFRTAAAICLFFLVWCNFLTCKRVLSFTLIC